MLVDRQALLLVLENGDSFNRGSYRPPESASHVELDRLLGRKVPAVADDVIEQCGYAFRDLVVRSDAPGHPGSLLVMRTLED